MSPETSVCTEKLLIKLNQFLGNSLLNGLQSNDYTLGSNPQTRESSKHLVLHHKQCRMIDGSTDR